MRLDYFTVAPEAIKAVAKSSQYLETSTIDPGLRAIVELRVSQINGCAYCVDMHSQQARRAGISTQQLDCLPAWRETELFDTRQRCALELAESVTRVESTHVPDDVYERATTAFSPKELVDLTVVIGIMNAWNRIAITFRRGPDKRKD